MILTPVQSVTVLICQHKTIEAANNLLPFVVKIDNNRLAVLASFNDKLT